MSRECHLPHYMAQSGSARGMFNTTVGKLQRQLRKGEYDMLKNVLILESDFIQISRRGEVGDMHHRMSSVTVGSACTSPMLPLPDIMLLARPATSCVEPPARGTKGRGRSCSTALELTRLLPLKFVRISVLNREKQQLHLKFVTGPSYYLQLCPPLDGREDLFSYWEQLIYLLRPPVEGNSNTHAVPAEDVRCTPVFKEVDRTSTASRDFLGMGDRDQVSIRSLHVLSEVSEASSAAFSGGQGIKYASQKPTSTPDVSTPKPAQPAKGAASGALAGAAGKGTAAGFMGATESTSANFESINVAIAGAAAKGPGGNRSIKAIACIASVPSKRAKFTVAHAATMFNTTVGKVQCQLWTGEYDMSKNVLSLKRDFIQISRRGEVSDVHHRSSLVTAGIACTSPKLPLPDITLRAQLATSCVEPPAWGTKGHTHSTAVSTTISPESSMNAEAQKPRGNMRKQRDKDSALWRKSSRPPKTGASQKTKAPEVGQTSLGRSLANRRSTEVDKKEKSLGSPGDSRRAATQKISNHTPSTKESKTSPKSGRSLSPGSLGSMNSRHSRISSFLKNVKAKLREKTAALPRGTEVAVSETVEGSSVAVTLETAECDQAVTIGVMTAETVESVISEAREIARARSATEDRGPGEYPHRDGSRPSPMLFK
ncbi:protein FAM71A-like [Choloepus didactylus]|uniref:protein FAM71A-like n=1 Tax=Choloepus didactylus TaxID=27675 RepID=UPI00189C9266|nr:protein FAM71A-like [Choloepus didactylus]